LTLLNVAHEEEAVWDAILRCRKSAELSSDYATSVGGRRGRQPIHVIVQDMVDPRFSGVLFTGNPATGDSMEMVLEYTEGLGDKLVGGEVTPMGSFDIRVPEIVHTRVEGKLLPVDFAAQLVALGMKIDAHFSRPMDIEWAIDYDNKLWCLQARPITGVDNWTIGDASGRAVNGGVGVGDVQWLTKFGDEEFPEGAILFASTPR